ncbi:hypothetical protein SK128_012099 [Halocaridina rubra]|uniref:Uncharacterized protein n=1 Tax=Halocaridina rubra TaxID=373956 RepID=A0AAN8ZWM3_HALRR
MKVLIFLSLLALAWAQENNCHCAMFISTGFAELIVHRLPPTTVADCDIESNGPCAAFCIAEWEYIFANGGLHFVNQVTGDTIGQESCQVLDKDYGMTNLQATKVHNNYQVCEGPWIWDGEISRGNLCCVDGNFPGSCAGK